MNRTQRRGAEGSGSSAGRRGRCYSDSKRRRRRAINLCVRLYSTLLLTKMSRIQFVIPTPLVRLTKETTSFTAQVVSPVGRLLVRLHLVTVKKFCTRWIAHNLTDAQKLCRINWCREMMQRFAGGDSNAVYDTIVGDKSWTYCYDPETKRQSAEWSDTGQIKRHPVCGRRRWRRHSKTFRRRRLSGLRTTQPSFMPLQYLELVRCHSTDFLVPDYGSRRNPTIGLSVAC
ncbi:hypothetical protein EVAR_6183_1 [Eumeta japonica]|uniref:Mariner Mos1 transposase n=1 Tax=Eumeta variegata TaxID=151549 RepID=A0A4C1TFF6_EUMVA|nr:hypothetical protein EVAR_6183_1 [Eumeta japonica]